MSMLDNHLIDEAINEEARALTDGAPGADVRARVSERIAASGWWSVVGGRWDLAGSRWSVVGGAAVVALVIAVLALWPDRDVTQVAEQPLNTPPGQAVGRAPSEAPQQAAVLNTPVGRAGRVRPTSDVIAPPPIVVPTVAPIELPAVAEIAPIEIEAIEEFEAVTLPMIVVEMIDIDPMEFQQ
jgi:hypothetical protein